MTLTFASTSFQGYFSRCKSAARAWLAVAAVAGIFQTFAPLTASAQTTVQLAQTPLLALKTTPGLVMLTMSRDHRLFYTAYNDTSDLDGDGLIDVGFKPAITYYGYFASDRCYRYESSTAPNRFVPTDFADATTICNTLERQLAQLGTYLAHGRAEKSTLRRLPTNRHARQDYS